jgi:hypothetical protein
MGLAATAPALRQEEKTAPDISSIFFGAGGLMKIL